MIQYTPFDCGVTWDSYLADLRSFDWHANVAEWDFPDEKRVLRVRFFGSVIVRILDDFALSTETDPAEWKGLVRDHFAYLVEGDAFHAAQSEGWKSVEGPTQHYRFLTGNACMDVVCSRPPTFETVEV
ncbi:hypothetical protein [Altericroceibacterium xinjiangense]|uniref:hypothetical protein n=1 Tax=Altericroceibacterium xinjiangense TaxID=762261 RepID=UPI000F7EBB3E|nr:hypothetical protein [Altericroceibacterium xinjiangense]